ncbi:MAG: bifunctional DNA primase/polymerase [Acidobacteria bacterium]|nr:bifunctional DNA primase/polymerase [Acidobacteriota bacterium]
MSAHVQKPSDNVSDLGDEQAFRRRRNHAQIEAMTGLILQAVGYPTRRHRDFICALQSTNSGNDARVPYTPFRRAHLTLADLMMCDGAPDARRKAVYREIVTLRTFQRRKGLILFNVTSGSEEEATEYIDYLTPAADAAVQRMLSSPLWKTDKQAAKREAVACAVEQLPRCDVEEGAGAEDQDPPLAEYQEQVRRRILAEVERAALKIEERGGDAELWARQLVKDALKNLESLKKTAPARLDHSALRAVLDDERGGGDTSVAGGNTTGDSSVRPPSADVLEVEHREPAHDHEEGADSFVRPPLGGADASEPFALDEPTLFSEGRPAVASKPKTPLEAALAYARRGWPVFPLHHPDPHRGCSCMEALKCRSPGKHPRTRKGLKDASTDPAQIRRWWELYPLAGVGLAMGRKSGLVALDVDPRSGGDASLCELIEAHGELPNTLEALTGGGGSHIFFAHPGVSFKNSSSVLGEGLDVKTDGGYVVAAPSLHASGKRYQWRTRRSPASMPGWLLKLLTQEKPPAPAKPSAPRRAAGSPIVGAIIPYRARNTQLFKLACSLRGDGAGYEEIERGVFDAYEQRCVKEPEPMTEAELRKIARSAMRYQPGK